MIRVSKSYLHCSVYSEPELVSYQNAIQHVFLVQVVNFFAIRLYNSNDWLLDMSDLHSWLSGQIVALSSCQWDIASSQWSKRFFCSSGGKARQSFLNLQNPTWNHLFPRAIFDCLREVKSFLQIRVDCANESSSSFANCLKSLMHARLNLKWDRRRDFRTNSATDSWTTARVLRRLASQPASLAVPVALAGLSES